MEELRDGNDVSNLFEDISSNSEIAWHDDLGMMGFGLTEASGLTDGFYYEDDGSFTNKGNEQGSGVYYFNDYMLRSPEDDLMNRGELVLFRQKRVGEYAKGGMTTTKIIAEMGGKDYYGKPLTYEAVYDKLHTAKYEGRINVSDTQIERVARKYPYSYKLAKGGKVNKKENNEMIIGGLAGIVLGIFLNK